MNNEMNKEEMANDFVDIDSNNKKDNYKIVVPILYLVIVILVILLIIGVNNQKDSKVNNNLPESQMGENK